MDFSFSLYLIHYPFVHIVYRWGAKNGFAGLEPSVMSLGIEVVLVTLICILAYFFSRITEARTAVLRDFIESKTSFSIAQWRIRKSGKQATQEN